MSENRVTKTLIMVNAVTDPINKRYSVLYFEDMDKNKYEYRFMESMTVNTRSKFFRLAKPHEYLPSALMKNNKPMINVTFRPGRVRYEPLTGRCIQQILYPVFESAEESREKPRKPRVFKKFYNM